MRARHWFLERDEKGRGDRRHRLPLAGSLLLLMLATSASTARAELITFVFEGTVETVFDGLGALGDAVEPGGTFQGSYTFDSDTPNTAPPVGEGELGLYHHEDPPNGVIIRIEPLIFRSVPATPDFDIHVANDFGFAGTDEYGFASFDNEALELFPSAPIDRLDISWLAIRFEGVPFTSADLPLTPPDLDILGGGQFEIEGECTVCLSPAAFFRIEGTLTALELPVSVSLSRDRILWSRLEETSTYDVVRGDLTVLRSGGGFFAAIDECLADNHDGSSLPFEMDPDPGEGYWVLSRSVSSGRNGTYDSGGWSQVAGRDESILLSGLDCP
jgi:hypothetical protein